MFLNFFNLPNKVKIGGMLAFHTGNHDSTGNPHSQYVLTELFNITEDTAASTKWAKILEVSFSSGKSASYVFSTINFGSNSSAVMQNCIIGARIYFGSDIASSTVMLRSSNDTLFGNEKLGYIIGTNSISIYIQSMYDYSGMQLKLINEKSETSVTKVTTSTFQINSSVIINPYRLKGLTTQRPTNVPTGFQYFDFNIAKPIWWNGTNWTNATGTIV